MTPEELRSEEIISNERIKEMARKMCTEYNPSVDYFVPGAKPNASTCYTFLGTAYTLFRRAFYLNASEEELLSLAKYIVTLLSSIERPLDIRKCKKDMNVDEIDAKYPIGYYMRLELDDIRRRNEEYENS